MCSCGLRPNAYGLFSRGFRNRLMQEESGALRARVELRPEWEMDNFSCSHCCLQLGDFGQGRVDADNTGASR
jgi:hypothetical protein